MDTTEERLNKIEDKIDAVYVSVEKTRKYILTSLIITLVMIGLPIILAVVAIPMILNSVSTMYGI